MRDEISVINKTGRVLWLKATRAKELVDKQLAFYFPNPKQDYYPQYDQGLSTYKSDVIKESKATLLTGHLSESLEVEIV